VDFILYCVSIGAALVRSDFWIGALTYRVEYQTKKNYGASVVKCLRLLSDIPGVQHIRLFAIGN